jgi:hypothetical protein
LVLPRHRVLPLWNNKTSQAFLMHLFEAIKIITWHLAVQPGSNLTFSGRFDIQWKG